MAIRGGRQTFGPLVLVSVVVLLLSGCFGGSSDESSSGTGNQSAGSGTAAAPAPAGSASAYPVAASASPSPLPVVASRSNGDWTFALNEVRRAGPGQLIVEGTLTSHNSHVLQGFEEPGFSLRKGADGKLDSTYEFSAVSLTVQGDTTVYQPMRDSSGQCACTQGVLNIETDQPYAVYTLLTAPQSASQVTVLVQSFAPFTNVPVTE